VASLGFVRLKTAWWERKEGMLLQMIHIHKFTFTTSFRVHAANHLEGFDEDVHWLNGMSSHDGWYERHILGLPVRLYTFDYTESSSSWQPSADILFEFTRDILIPWIEKWSDVSVLQTRSDSPLNETQKSYLARA
jgi:hypothetical protein